jgi:arsenate reductase
MITIYHNPKCAKSRAGLEFLKTKDVEYKVVEYLKEPLTREQFKDILMKLGKSPKDIIRTQEEIYKEKFRGKNFTDDEWITILLENPKLIQRPIVVKGYKAILAQPAEEIEKLLK